MEGIGKLAVSQSVGIQADRPQGRRIPVHGDDEQSVFGRFPKDVAAAFDESGKGVDVTVGVEGNEAAGLKRVMSRPQTSQSLGPAEDIPVFPPPRIRPSVVRIFAACKAGFVAVIDAGRTGHGHLPRRQEFQPLLGRRFRIFYVGAAGSAQDGQDPFDVMAADEVEHGIKIFRR